MVAWVAAGDATITASTAPSNTGTSAVTNADGYWRATFSRTLGSVSQTAASSASASPATVRTWFLPHAPAPTTPTLRRFTDKIREPHRSPGRAGHASARDKSAATAPRGKRAPPRVGCHPCNQAAQSTAGDAEGSDNKRHGRSLPSLDTPVARHGARPESCIGGRYARSLGRQSAASPAAVR